MKMKQAEILYRFCGNKNMSPGAVKEGKIEVITECDGLLKVDRKKLNALNHLGEMMIAQPARQFPCEKRG